MAIRRMGLAAEGKHLHLDLVANGEDTVALCPCPPLARCSVSVLAMSSRQSPDRQQTRPAKFPLYLRWYEDSHSTAPQVLFDP